ncbi:hypothetical protein AWB79_01859 [Caballeronia hypogeia]|uniref:Lipoprotein n=1 Tax=Caballeronia hypogeia TaxID=1777140 RepID=A0A158A3R7_9BURK|nr:hypothetical protein [Caballeronia hypogeia]SAK52276.1 hypothetical protein AWB79_01859 [Caballeronia hypogeia]
MKTQSIRVSLVAFAFVLGCSQSALSFAQSAPCAEASANAANAAKPVYVRDFTPVSQQSGSSHLLGSRLRSARNSVRVEQNATALAQGIVKALNGRGIAACHFTDQSALPSAGWMVSGEFDETLASGFGAGLPSMGSSDKPPNTHVTVQLADLSTSPDQSSARIDTSAELKGQKSAAAPKPYGAAARFVINKTESISSLDDLAGKIAEQIAAEKAKLDGGAQ